MYAKFHLTRELQNELVCGKAHYSSMPLHFHSHLEVYVIRSGEIEVLLNDRRRVLGEGELCISFSYDAHGYRTVKESVADYLIIPLDCCGSFLPLLNNYHGGSQFINDPETYQIVCNAMDRLQAGGNALSRYGNVYTVLGAILDQLPVAEAQVQPAAPRFLSDVLIYIGSHFKEDLTLGEVAREFGYHPSYLSGSFRRTFRISFVQYLTMLRLREAILLLKTGEKSVTECAMESGFGSMRSFYRAFGEEFGCTPREYLKAETNGRV